MLKYLAISTMAYVLVMLQGNTDSHPKQQHHYDQAPSSPVANPTIQQTASQPLQNEREQHVDANVRILQTPNKDSYDKAAFWINVALAGVGLLGIGVGIGTLVFLKSQTAHIKRQADLMDAQAKDARESSAQTFAVLKEQTDNLLISAKAATASALAADDSAKAAAAQIQMMRAKERAWLSIDFDPLKFLNFDWLGDFDMVDARIENYGFSHALNVRIEGGAVLYAMGDQMPEPPNVKEADAPDVVRSGNTAKASLGLEKRVKTEDVVEDNLRWGVFAVGAVFYDDVFGQPHQTKFQRQFVIWKMEATATKDMFQVADAHDWFKTGEPEKNCAT